jgi:hypothetical protein
VWRPSWNAQLSATSPLAGTAQNIPADRVERWLATVDRCHDGTPASRPGQSQAKDPLSIRSVAAIPLVEA